MLLIFYFMIKGEENYHQFINKNGVHYYLHSLGFQRRVTYRRHLANQTISP
jgi:hypothetical protein